MSASTCDHFEDLTEPSRSDGIHGPMTDGHPVVTLEFSSVLEMLDLVQRVSDHVGRSVGLDDDSVHWVDVATRESVINAIKHGNRGNPSKRVFVEFAVAQLESCPELRIKVRDEGEGFDPAALPDPLDPDNLLRAHGRGIFLIQRFMDWVELRRVPDGGMEIVMAKRGIPPKQLGPE
jgi:serine/threonine-protein kinase RsbW